MYDEGRQPRLDPETVRTFILARSDTADRLEGESPSGACRVRLGGPVDRPLLAVALHAGSRLPPEAAANMKASTALRRSEEDPYTDRLVADLPLTLVVRDSRFAYDVNRSPAEAVARSPAQVWGLDLWRAPPDEDQVARALARWREVHDLIDAAVAALVERFGVALVFDCHSYNRRAAPPPERRSQPLFDVGTGGSDRTRWAAVIEDWKARLAGVRLPGVETTVGENQVYDGRGELVLALRRRHPDALVLPTEVRKDFMDPRTGAPDEAAIAVLRRELARAARETALLLRAPGLPLRPRS